MNRLIEYYHRKRIHRIQNLNYRLQPISIKQWTLFSRDARVQFLLILFFLFLFGIPVKLISSKVSSYHGTFILGLFVAWAAVEVSDWIWAKSLKFLDSFFDLIFPLILGFFLIAIFAGFMFFDLHIWGASQFKKWVKSKNEIIQSKPIDVHLALSRGSNWQLLVNEKNSLVPLTYEKAQQYCESIGKNWRIWSEGDTFRAKPELAPLRPFYVWASPNLGILLDKEGVGKSGIYVSSDPGDKQPVLCILETEPKK